MSESKPAISTTYPVTTAASIPSDKAGHKVHPGYTLEPTLPRHQGPGLDLACYVESVVT